MKHYLTFIPIIPTLILSSEYLQGQTSLKWNKHDFVPGEKVIFEDNQEGEVNGGLNL
jgi:hypothetical protein